MMTWLPLGLTEYVLGEPLPIRDPKVVFIWGAINLLLAVVWLTYCLGMWRKRTCSGENEKGLSNTMHKETEVEGGAKVVVQSNPQIVETASVGVTV